MKKSETNEHDDSFGCATLFHWEFSLLKSLFGIVKIFIPICFIIVSMKYEFLSGSLSTQKRSIWMQGIFWIDKIRAFNLN